MHNHQVQEMAFAISGGMAHLCMRQALNKWISAIVVVKGIGDTSGIIYN